MDSSIPGSQGVAGDNAPYVGGQAFSLPTQQPDEGFGQSSPGEMRGCKSELRPSSTNECANTGPRPDWPAARGANTVEMAASHAKGSAGQVSCMPDEGRGRAMAAQDHRGRRNREVDAAGIEEMKRWCVAVTAAAALVLVGCSSDPAASPPEQTSTTQPSPLPQRRTNPNLQQHRRRWSRRQRRNRSQ